MLRSNFLSFHHFTTFRSRFFTRAKWMYFDIIFVLQNAPKVNAYYFKSHPNSIRPKAPSDEGAVKNLRFLTEGEIQRQHFLSPSRLLWLLSCSAQESNALRGAWAVTTSTTPGSAQSWILVIERKKGGHPGVSTLIYVLITKLILKD